MLLSNHIDSIKFFKEIVNYKQSIYNISFKIIPNSAKRFTISLVTRMDTIVNYHYCYFINNVGSLVIHLNYIDSNNISTFILYLITEKKEKDKYFRTMDILSNPFNLERENLAILENTLNEYN